MPLFHSIASSLQLMAHARIHKPTKTHEAHARLNANAFLKASCPLLLFFFYTRSSAVTFCPDTSLKSVTGSGGMISPMLWLQMGRGERSEEIKDWRTGVGPSRQKRGLLCFFVCVLHMSRFELDWKLNHITAFWLSCMHAEAQTIGNQIRTQVHTCCYFTLYLSKPFLSFFLALILYMRLLPPLVFFLKAGWPLVSRFRNQCGGLFRQAGTLLLHLTNSPVHLSNRVWDWKSPVNWTE